ncbi:glycosyltransferase [Eubacteriales bacterium OttesenSCG-928-M02]|nr:glycosyltransferase [Eubacteriales bacterium OttesenSCG-928-M02]
MNEKQNIPSYSVLMSLYYKERPEHLIQSVQSMLDQTILPEKMVLVKDGSLTEDLENVLNSFNRHYPKMFHIIALEENQGLGNALSIGIQACETEFILRMDTDDIAKPDRAKKLLTKMVEGGYDIVGSVVEEFVGDPQNIVSLRIVPEQHEEILRFLRLRSPFNHPSIAYRKSKVLEAGNYPSWRACEDYELFSAMLSSGAKAYNLQEPLLLMRSDGMVGRRMSKANLKYVILSRKRNQQRGLAKWYHVCITAIAQCVLYLLPVKISKRIYMTFLRDKPSKEDKR